MLSKHNRRLFLKPLFTSFSSYSHWPLSVSQLSYPHHHITDLYHHKNFNCFFFLCFIFVLFLFSSCILRSFLIQPFLFWCAYSLHIISKLFRSFVHHTIGKMFRKSFLFPHQTNLVTFFFPLCQPTCYFHVILWFFILTHIFPRKICKRHRILLSQRVEFLPLKQKKTYILLL